MQIRILSSKAINDDVTIHLMAKWDMESYFRLILYLNMKKNWGSRCIPKSYNGFCIGMFLPHICYVLKELARTDIYLEFTLILLIMVIKR